MTRVPEFLPAVLAFRNWRNRSMMGGPILPGTNVPVAPEPPATRMDLIVFPSPALVHGLLMTEITTERNWNDPNKRQRVERFFFGYRCGDCQEVFLIRKNARNLFDIERDIIHDCDPSDIRQAVRRARDIARERDEYIIEGTHK